MSWSSIVQEHGWRKGPWNPEEDKLLIEYVHLHGEGRWSSVARCAGLNRSGKSCRLRWVNYLRPGLKRGQITPQEEVIIIELHAIWGNKWSTIARYLPGRTDNEIKNYWRTHFKKKKERSRKISQGRKSQDIEPKPLVQSQPQEQPLIETQVQDQGLMEIEDQNLMMMMSLTSSWMDATCHDQDGTWWGSLWNFGDQMQQHDGHQCCSKTLQNQATSSTNNIIINNNNNGLSWEGDPNNNIYNNNNNNNNGWCIY